MPIPADYTELPSATLDPRRIEALWSFAASSPGHHIVLPDGRMDLVVPHRADARGRLTSLDLMVAGPSRTAHLVPVAPGDRFLGLRLRAGWGGHCLGLDPRALRDGELRGAAADGVLGAHAARLRSCATSCATVADLHEAVVATGRALAAFGGRPARAGADEASVDRALDLLHLAGGRLAMPELARIVGVPERSLRRRVEEAVGLSFKALASVLRFQRTLRLLAGPEGRTLTLAQAALEAGYADQAHMTREFRRHGGFTPARQPPVALGSLPLGGLAETFKIEAASPA